LKERGSLKIIFISRITIKKNLFGAIKMLDGLKGKITLNIYGPIEDKAYWKTCRQYSKRLSTNIQVFYKGILEHNYVMKTMSEHDLFLFPTLGENYGHVIIEALSSGCPILISDQTPWRNLEEEGVGWDLPLRKPEKFSRILQKCVHMDLYEHSVYSNKAREYARLNAKDGDAIKKNCSLFYKAIKL
jgi:glycosyltransferase involved in cell wall biosynthesis